MIKWLKRFLASGKDAPCYPIEDAQKGLKLIATCLCWRAIIDVENMMNLREIAENTRPEEER